MFKENYAKYEQMLSQQRQNWDRFSDGWQKWDDLMMTALKPVGDSMIKTLKLKGNETILDVASGTGEPGLSLCAKLPEGTVFGTDLSEKMVKHAIENSHQKDIHNYQGRVCDAANLPFANNTFDHVICRFGIMFFPDLMKGLKEMTRVLKSGGSMTVAVWAAPELNPLITLMSSIVASKLNLSPPPPDAPGIFRCAQPGLTSGLFQKAGLEAVTENNIRGLASFDTPQQYWDVMTDVAGPIMQAMVNASRKTVKEIEHEVIQTAGAFEKNGNMSVDWEAILVSGLKPAQ